MEYGYCLIFIALINKTEKQIALHMAYINEPINESVSRVLTLTAGLNLIPEIPAEHLFVPVILPLWLKDHKDPPHHNGGAHKGGKEKRVIFVYGHKSSPDGRDSRSLLSSVLSNQMSMRIPLAEHEFQSTLCLA